MRSYNIRYGKEGIQVYACRKFRSHHSCEYAEDFPREVVSLSISVFGNCFFVKGFLFRVHHKGIFSSHPSMPFPHKIYIHLTTHFSCFGIRNDAPGNVGRFQGGGLFLIVAILSDYTHTPKSIVHSAFEHSSRRSA